MAVHDSIYQLDACRTHITMGYNCTHFYQFWWYGRDFCNCH